MSGRCVAGRELLANKPGAWIRPVSRRDSEEVSEYERQFEDGSDPRVLDVIDIPLTASRPHACQTENWLLEPDEYWILVRKIGWAELLSFAERPQTLWIDGYSTYHGQNDEIARPLADKLPCSLHLIHVRDIQLKVFAPGASFGNAKRRVLAKFEYSGVQYWLWVTDPLIEREYLGQPDGTYPLGESCICVSLGEPFTKNGNECRYKLVASIIQRAVVLK